MAPTRLQELPEGNLVDYQTNLGALIRISVGFTPQTFLLPEISARQGNDSHDGRWLETIRPLTGLVLHPAGYRALSITGEKNLLIARHVSAW